MRKLFLDDVRKAPDYSWDVVRSFREFCAYITLHGMPDVISFDHDLGEGESGCDCAKWLVENHGVPKEYRIHSMNPPGRDNIKFALEAARRAMARSA